VTPTSESASRTSSSLNGFTMASIFFMAVLLPRFGPVSLIL
jgi:hypothetical protein